MTKPLLSAAVLAVALVAGSHAARADGPAAMSSPVAESVGIGLEYQLNGLGGISANYDAGQFHVGGFFSYDDPAGPNNSAFELGGRFFFHVHRTATADFSVGGGLGFVNADTGPTTSQTAVVLEPSFQIRWFAASNLALSFTGGFSIGLTNDDKDFSFGGPLNKGVGIFGVHYYFTK